ncbi:FecR family protein [Membranihabitans maritimus]|uniref:FecR family protein n=1 Tax=Membranihabitans maritimus TaxID=2904244 RepID=UPI001F341206|nr:FecR family protein [Membranihabitans maritimus]
MENKEIDNILKKIACGTASEKEKEYLSNWLDQINDSKFRYVLDRYQVLVKEYGHKIELDEKLRLRIEGNISGSSRDSKYNSRLLWMKIREVAATAAIVILAIWGSWKVFDQWIDKDGVQVADVEPKSKYGDDVMPGGNKAVMTLAGGRTIVLDDLPDGAVTNEGGIKLEKTGQGQILLDLMADDGKQEVSYHTVSTPNGGEYQVTLPDGSIVWLNSASSITCPTRFDDKNRVVEVTGEAYFDIKKYKLEEKNIPFIVRTKNQEVEVLGTQFNIKAYGDKEEIATTLVEGKVKILSGDNSVFLSPGQQVKVSSTGGMAIESDVDIEKILAWKNGYFYFSDDSIDDVMNEISRWYDIDVDFVGRKPEVGFGGQVSREKNVSEVLRILELTGTVNFIIEGKRIKVYKE